MDDEQHFRERQKYAVYFGMCGLWWVMNSTLRNGRNMHFILIPGVKVCGTDGSKFSH